MNDVHRALDSQASYRLFRKDYAEGKLPLVVVCGSGLSVPANLPTWAGLRHKLQQEAESSTKFLPKIGEALQKHKTDAIRNQHDPWVAFKLLQEVLTKPTFEKLVIESLTPAADVDTPGGYKKLLELQPRGFVTLNLDKYAGDALADAQPGKQILPIYGKELAQKWYVLQNSPTYLVYLHGILDDPSTWILTQDDLSDIRENEGHSLYLKELYTNNLVLFTGMSADDVAVSGRLLELTQSGFRPRNLYWLTPRTDPATTTWASNSYISLINYPTVSPEDHNRAISKLVQDCLSFRPTDTKEPPLTGIPARIRPLGSIDIENPTSLAQMEPEFIRYSLAIALDDILKSEPEEEHIKLYREFCEKYDFALNRAFYKSKADEFSKWFGYSLNFPPIGRGNFGEVYSAISPNGELVAVKVMHFSVFYNDDMLGGFRRGVRSMNFINDQHVLGMVPIRESFELPPTIIMDFVSGSSLEDALRDAPKIPWLTRLEIAYKTASIIRTGHLLPQTVLHRDVKPSNIMITNLEYDGSFDPDVVVLDFDMSWHKGSKEKDITFESRDDFGYLAPEQTDAASKYTARNTKVDSYGFGMTTYYLFGLQAPLPNEGLSADWYKKALSATSRLYDGSWRSAAARLARLICRTTSIDQSERLDFSSAFRELERIRSAIYDQTNLRDPGLWAEEVLHHVDVATDYNWSDDEQSGEIFAPSGIFISIRGDYRAETVEVKVGYADRGMRERSTLGKYLSQSVVEAGQALTKGGWRVLDSRHGNADAQIRAFISTETLASGAVSAMRGTTEAWRAFDFQ